MDNIWQIIIAALTTLCGGGLVLGILEGLLQDFIHDLICKAFGLINPKYKGVSRGKLMKKSKECKKTMMARKFGNVVISKDILSGLSDSEDDIINVIENAHKNGRKHVMIVGDGGMGKTVSLLYLWEKLIKSYSRKQALPIYIPLNGYNNFDVEKGANYIAEKIRELYFYDYSDEKIADKKIYESLNMGNLRSTPSAVLLLDGFNEITCDDKDALIYELHHIMENYANIQLIVTSRYDARINRGWTKTFEKYELVPLGREKIEKYLSGKNIAYPEDEGVRRLITNPMMLTLYSNVKTNYNGKNGGEESREINSCGELMHTYMNDMVEREFITGSGNKEAVFKKFLIKYLLPYIGYRMESQGNYSLYYDELCEIIKDSGTEYASDLYRGLLSSDAEFGIRYKEILHLEDLDVSSIINILLVELCMLVDDGNGVYSFLHQNYRDYFSAVYVTNNIRAANFSGKTAEVLKERLLPVYIVKFVGEIEREHRFRAPLEELTYQYSPNESIFSIYLERLRGDFVSDHGFIIRNMVEIWKTARGEISGINFSRLNLKGCIFNNVICGKNGIGNATVSANFAGSMLDFSAFKPRGHYQWVYSVSYCDGDRNYISASRDGYVKEWDGATGECIYAFKNAAEVYYAYLVDQTHIACALSNNTVILLDKKYNKIEKRASFSAKITDACYCEEKNSIFIGTADGVFSCLELSTFDVREITHTQNKLTCLDVNKRGMRAVLGDEAGNVYEVNLSSGSTAKYIVLPGKNITSIACGNTFHAVALALDNGKVYEWNLLRGMVYEYEGHTEQINQICYNADFTKLLTASNDNLIKEWSVVNHICLHTYSEHYDGVFYAVYSGDGKRILSGSRDFSIREWSVFSGECMTEIIGLSYFSRSTCFSKDGNRILSALCDNTIREWSVPAKLCMNIYKGHKGRVYSAMYNEDNTKILSASLDKTVCEWNVGGERTHEVCATHDSCVDKAIYIDNEHIVSVSNDNVIKFSAKKDGVWVTENEKELDYKACSGGIVVGTNAVHHVDGKYFSCHWDGNIIRWDMENKTPACIYSYHKDWVYSCVFSPDGKYMYSSSRDGVVCKWEIESGEFVGAKNLGLGSVYTMALGADGKSLLCAVGNEALTLNIDFEHFEDIEIVQRTVGHTGRVFSATYNADFTQFVTFSEDLTIRVWNAETFECVSKLHNIMGIIIDGCDFSDTKNFSGFEYDNIVRNIGGDFSEEYRERIKEYLEIIEQYGGIVQY